MKSLLKDEALGLLDGRCDQLVDLRQLTRCMSVGQTIEDEGGTAIVDGWSLLGGSCLAGRSFFSCSALLLGQVVDDSDYFPRARHSGTRRCREHSWKIRLQCSRHVVIEVPIRGKGVMRNIGQIGRVSSRGKGPCCPKPL